MGNKKTLVRLENQDKTCNKCQCGLKKDEVVEKKGDGYRHTKCK